MVGRQRTGETDDGLIGPIGVVRPVGRIAKFQGLAESGIAIVRVAQEQVLFGVEMIIEAQTDLLASIRAAVRILEQCERRICGLNTDGLNLIEKLVIEEERTACPS